jgi:epoxyqueuosine reductase
LRASARDVGFDLVGITRFEALADERERLRGWIRAGRHATMGYLAHTYKSRGHPPFTYDWARSVIVVGVSVNAPVPSSDRYDLSSRGWVARYALGRDYHDWILERLELLEARAREILPGAQRFHRFCDTSALPEKRLAVAAGLGRQGRNSLLINNTYGSWIALGGLLLDQELPPDPPSRDRCPPGCRACMEACPTGALDGQSIDARRCLSFYTTNTDRPPPEDPELREALRGRLYGCDLCQEACPDNRHAAFATQGAFRNTRERLAPELEDLQRRSDQALTSWIGGSPMQDRGVARLKRNLNLCKK